VQRSWRLQAQPLAGSKAKTPTAEPPAATGQGKKRASTAEAPKTNKVKGPRRDSTSSKSKAKK
jgi:hypothetical protein